MIDKKTGVQILKVDADGKPLAGAKLAIKDSAGNIVESWTSTTSAHSIEGTLAEGSNYVLTEIEAPTGYRKALYSFQSGGKRKSSSSYNEGCSNQSKHPQD